MQKSNTFVIGINIVLAVLLIVSILKINALASEVSDLKTSVDKFKSVEYSSEFTMQTFKAKLDNALEEQSTESNTFDESALPEEAETVSVVETVVIDEPSDESLYSWEDLNLLAKTMYFESNPYATLEDLLAIGLVIDNRLNDPAWKADSYYDVIYRKGQFAVINLAKFEDFDIFSSTDPVADLAIKGAKMILTDTVEDFSIPSDVQYFYGDPNRRSWGSHVYYATFGDNAFFY